MEYIIRYDGNQTVEQLKNIGNIIYQSSFLQMVTIATHHSKEELLNVDGVISVSTRQEDYRNFHL